MEQYPQLPPPPETIFPPQYRNYPNKIQYYPQSAPSRQYPGRYQPALLALPDTRTMIYPMFRNIGPTYPGQPAGTPMFYPQAQPMQAYPFPPPPPPPPPPQNQQQSTPMIIQQSPLESYVGHQIFACIVLWFFNLPFGLIAWILALVADSEAKSSDRKAAQRLGKASLGLSISGIIVSVITVAIVLGVIYGLGNKGSSSSSSSTSTSTSSCPVTLNGVCYTTRRYAYYTCTSVYFDSYSSCCYSYEDAYSNYYCYSR